MWWRRVLVGPIVVRMLIAGCGGNDGHRRTTTAIAAEHPLTATALAVEPGHGDIPPPDPTGAHRIEPTDIVLPSLGCWQVAGGVGRDVLTWIFLARAHF